MPAAPQKRPLRASKGLCSSNLGYKHGKGAITATNHLEPWLKPSGLVEHPSGIGLEVLRWLPACLLQEKEVQSPKPPIQASKPPVGGYLRNRVHCKKAGNMPQGRGKTASTEHAAEITGAAWNLNWLVMVSVM